MIVVEIDSVIDRIVDVAIESNLVVKGVAIEDVWTLFGIVVRIFALAAAVLLPSSLKITSILLNMPEIFPKSAQISE